MAIHAEKESGCRGTKNIIGGIRQEFRTNDLKSFYPVEDNSYMTLMPI